MRPCINSRFCEWPECDPMACGNCVPPLTSTERERDVARLRKLEAKATSENWIASADWILTEDPIDIDGEGDRPIEIPHDEDDAAFIAANRNAAPWLLDVAGQFQEGDAAILELFVHFMEHYRPDGHLSDKGPGKDITNAQAMDCLCRMHAAARMSRHRGAKGPAERQWTLAGTHSKPVRPYAEKLPPHLRNVASRSQRGHRA